MKARNLILLGLGVWVVWYFARRTRLVSVNGELSYESSALPVTVEDVSI